MERALGKFWEWYERNYTANVGAAAGLFALQVLHLYWLTTDVVAARLFGESFFTPSAVWEFLIAVIDYTEIPAIIGVSLVYINELRKKWSWSSAWVLFFLNSQWLHLFWITDEIVASQLTGGIGKTALPIWLAWLAIIIDYLELPVILDTGRRLVVLMVDKLHGS